MHCIFGLPSGGVKLFSPALSGLAEGAGVAFGEAMGYDGFLGVF